MKTRGSVHWLGAIAVVPALATTVAACTFSSTFHALGDGAAGDAAAADSGFPDSAVPDSAVPDSGFPDSAVPDSGFPDSAVPDSAVPDSAAPDSGFPDSAAPDSGFPDSGTPDSGRPDAGCVEVADGGPAGPWNGYVVTVANDDLNGGGSITTVAEAGGCGDLSLREAITIANNRAGPETIVFDPAVFDPLNPATIPVGSGSAGLVPLPVLTGGGIVIDGRSAGVVLSGQFLLDNGETSHVVHGVELNSDGNRIIMLWIVRFPGSGIQVNGGTGNQILLNRIGVAPDGTLLGNHTDGIGVHQSGSLLTVETLILQNLILNNWDDGIEISWLAGYTRVYHNTIGLHTEYGVSIGCDEGHVANNIVFSCGYCGSCTGYAMRGNHSGVIFDTNLLFNNALSGCECGSSVWNNELTGDPLFENAPLSYVLLTGSPAIDQGIPLGFDLNGGGPGDYDGLGPDLGAFESE